jgi:coenzyme F420-0:L-glutamate ligase/coenzyme F420-1:gamma-L-glutamate ligase
MAGHTIGWAGVPSIRDFRGDTDIFGHVIKVTEEAVVADGQGLTTLFLA